MKRVEGILGVESPEDYRRNLINMIAAFAIDHPDEEIVNSRIFPRQLEQVREAYFAERRGQVAATIDGMLTLLSESDEKLDAAAEGTARAAVGRMEAMGYCDKCGRAALAELRRERYG
jgi:hypothetical protein